MAVNYAKVYNQKAVEAFTLASITRGVLSTDYDFVSDAGKTVVLSSNDTATMKDYKRTGTWRYGDPEELGNTQQEVSCTRDRSFSFTIDRMNRTEMGMVNEAGAALRRQIDKVITPEIDIWTLSKLVSGCDAANTITGALTTTDVYDKFLQMGVCLDDNLVPMTDRVAFVSSAMYRALKLDDAFIKNGDLGQQMIVNGQVGEVDGVRIIKTPSSYLPENVWCVMAHKSAAIQPIRLEAYKTFEDVPGINGWLCEGRVVYDAFVLDARKKGIAIFKNAV